MVRSTQPAGPLTLKSEEGLRLDLTGSRPGTIVDLVRDALRSSIIRGDLPAGSSLVQTEIATQLNVSTTPVREAMRDLAGEGLITLDSHRIGTVRGLDWEEMVEIVEVRRAIDKVALKRAMANIKDEELTAARNLADQLSREDLGSWVQLNSRFHIVFHRATRTKRLGTMLAALEAAGGVFVAQAQRLHPELRRRAIVDHYALLDAFEARDLRRAHQVQFEHVNLPLESAEVGPG